jgi:large subunit ribosomal protein L23
MTPEQIIIKPWLTEKTTRLREKQNKYTFIVDKTADKIQIAKAVKAMFDVNPIKVNVVNCHGKLKKVRYKYGFTSSFKKCIVTLKKGEKIGIFEAAV